MGQRIVKIVKPHKKVGSVAVLAPQSEWEYTFYQLDATGNVLATYHREYELVSGTTYKSKYGLEEQYIYGSSRLGSIEQNQPDFESTFTATITTTGTDDDDEYFVLTSGFSSNAYAVNPGTSGVYEEYDHKTGWRHYEQVNHLGNVMSVISDRKVPVDRYNFINTGGSYTHGLSNVMGTYVTGATTLTHKISTGTDGTADGWMAEVQSYSDYYGFGMLMPGRNGNSGDYSYGFNGQEKDDEIYGSGNAYTAMFWEYDPRLGRRWNPDPIVKHHESPYAAFSNNPIWFIDPNGADTTLAGAGGNSLRLPDGATDIKTFKTDKYTVNGKEYTNEAVKNTVQSFKIGDVEFQAYFDTKTGDFTGYKASEYNGEQDFEYTYTRGSYIYARYQTSLGYSASYAAAIAITLESPAAKAIISKTPAGLIINLINAANNINIFEFDEPVGNPRPLDSGEIKKLKSAGWDPHGGEKPKQGGPGGKIDIYIDNVGNMFYKTAKGTNWEPIYENYYKLIGK